MKVMEFFGKILGLMAIGFWFAQLSVTMLNSSSSVPGRRFSMSLLLNSFSNSLN
jgi:hypothetical protein